MKSRLLLKLISCILVFTFSYSNLLYAADISRMIQNAKAGFDLEDQRRSGGGEPLLPSAPTQFEASNLSAVNQKNNLQDLEGLNFSLTTQNGDILKYVGNKLNQIQTSKGVSLQNISLSQDGKIQNADLKLSDGSIQVLQNGQIIGYQTPDGTQVLYQDNQIQKTIKDSVETIYSYIKDQNNNLTQTILDNPQTKTVYDSQGDRKSVV